LSRPGPTSLVEDVEVFDLGEASARLWPFTRRTRNVGIFAGSGAILFALLVVFVSLRLVARGEMTGFNWFVLAVFCFVAAVGASMAVGDSLHRVPGAHRIKISLDGVTLSYPGGKEVSRAWTDPGLGIVLYDFSRSKSRAYKTPEYPYMLRDHGVDSLLTEAAYCALLDWARRHATLEGPAPGSSWYYPSDAIPETYRIVSRMGALPETGTRRQI
jgi:hypothetical protein